MTWFITRKDFYTIYRYGTLLVHVFDSGNIITARLMTQGVDWDEIHRATWDKTDDVG